MKRINTKQFKHLAITISIIIIGVLVSAAFLYIKDINRESLECEKYPGRGLCLDLRGLDDIKWIAYITLVSCIIAVIYAAVQFRNKQPYSKTSLAVSVLALIPILYMVILTLFNG